MYLVFNVQIRQSDINVHFSSSLSQDPSKKFSSNPCVAILSANPTTSVLDEGLQSLAGQGMQP
ncbi:MAG TPA: hypothetical protein DCE56_24230 [Cyanobacteria bacterium UBA8553]|nr:hypothetical protein [Cyanobacteria bacterium UBA8553]